MIASLTEKKPGIFYVGRVPMLHFHETDDGIAADLKNLTTMPAVFDRFLLSSSAAQQRLLRETTTRVSAIKARR